jgi:hypothetical protein
MGFDLHEALTDLYPNLSYTMSNNNYDTLNWLERDIPKPSKEMLLRRSQELIDARPLKKLRQERNRRLAEVDWIFTSDYDLSVSDHAVWMAYRKALRDLPSTTEDPANPVWPEKPPLPKGETLTLKMSDTVISGKSQITLLQNVVYNLTKRIEALENA